MTQKLLADKRARINEIDAGILALLDERMKLAIDIAQIKKSTGKDIEDLARETELLEGLKTLNTDTCMPDEKILEIWGKILELSKKIQEDEPS